MNKPSDIVRICVGISGASGAQIAIKLLKRIKDMTGVETHLIITEGARLTINQETDYSVSDVEALADYVYNEHSVGERPASGSFPMDAMIVVPCSMKTLAGIASGYSDNLLLRTADVTLKEARPLILVARESPLSQIHLRNLYEVSRCGARIIPPMLSYYQHYETIDEWTDNFVERLLRELHLDTNLMEWQGYAEKLL